MRIPGRPGFLEKISRRGGRFAAGILAAAAVGLAGNARSQTFTEFVIPTGTNAPLGIAAGPDGNMWFTENPFSLGGRGPNDSRIGRITPAGVITEFALPGSGRLSGPIVAGADGALWFGEDGKIGRITTAGAITELTLPIVSSTILGIAAGPDGNLWFAKTVFDSDGSNGRIGRVSPSIFTGSPPPFPAITEFTVPAANLITDLGLTFHGSPMNIVSSPDGNLWFTDSEIGKIGRITTAGAITELTPPTPFGGPAGIAAGPNGDLWFTEFFANRIGRISALGQACTPSPTSLCLSNARFKMEATWTASDGRSGPGQAVALTPDGGYFWFFSPRNTELLVNVIDGCSFNNHYWVFGAGLTNVGVVLRVTDPHTGQVSTYTNPQGTAFQPIQDTSAFACP